MRRIKRRSAEKSIAVIIDGKDEKWYLETIKEHYPNVAMKKTTIKPDLPQKKSVEECLLWHNRNLQWNPLKLSSS